MIRLTYPALFALILSFFGVGLAWTTGQQAAAKEGAADVVSIGNAVTEIVYALGQEHRLVARDSTSTYPAAAQDLPNIGYMRALSAEGVLSVGPNLIISTEGAGPPEVVDVLKSTGLNFIEVPEGYTPEAISEKILIIGRALEVEDAAETLAAEVTADIAAAMRNRAEGGAPKRVMFVMSAQGGKLIAAGQDTSAGAIIELAGGVNAVDGYSGWKTIEDEAATAAAPDFVLMMSRAGNHSADAETLFALPSLSTTPAAQNSALIKMEGQKALGFGPRTAEAIRELNTALYGAE
ncbi:MAG: ABC transporter substrate-binding protein [Pseudomonadota bacterium]